MKYKKVVLLFILILIFFNINIMSSKANTTIIDMSEVKWSTNSFVYDGTYKSIYLENLPKNFPEDISIIYQNNYYLECGLYKASVSFSYDKDKYSMENMKFSPERDWQIRQKEIIDETGTIIITADYGIHPNQTVVYKELDLDDYIYADISAAGAYQEVKKAFTVTMIEDGRSTMPDGVVVIEFVIPDELLYVEDLKIYDYGMNRINTVDSRIKDGMIVFTTHHLSNVYLVVGMRSTYTNNQIWKAFLIFAVCGVGIVGIVVAIKVKKRKEERIKLDKEMYTRSKLR